MIMSRKKEETRAMLQVWLAKITPLEMFSIMVVAYIIIRRGSLYFPTIRALYLARAKVVVYFAVGVLLLAATMPVCTVTYPAGAERSMQKGKVKKAKKARRQQPLRPVVTKNLSWAGSRLSTKTTYNLAKITSIPLVLGYTTRNAHIREIGWEIAKHNFEEFVSHDPGRPKMLEDLRVLMDFFMHLAALAVAAILALLIGSHLRALLQAGHWYWSNKTSQRKHMSLSNVFYYTTYIPMVLMGAFIAPYRTAPKVVGTPGAFATRQGILRSCAGVAILIAAWVIAWRIAAVVSSVTIVLIIIGVIVATMVVPGVVLLSWARKAFRGANAEKTLGKQFVEGFLRYPAVLSREDCMFWWGTKRAGGKASVTLAARITGRIREMFGKDREPKEGVQDIDLVIATPIARIVAEVKSYAVGIGAWAQAREGARYVLSRDDETTKGLPILPVAVSVNKKDGYSRFLSLAKGGDAVSFREKMVTDWPAISNLIGLVAGMVGISCAKQDAAQEEWGYKGVLPAGDGEYISELQMDGATLVDFCIQIVGSRLEL